MGIWNCTNPWWVSRSFLRFIIVLCKTIQYPILRHYYKFQFCLKNSINDLENHKFFEGCEIIGTNGPFYDFDFFLNYFFFQKPELVVLSLWNTKEKHKVVINKIKYPLLQHWSKAQEIIHMKHLDKWHCTYSTLTLVVYAIQQFLFH